MAPCEWVIDIIKEWVEGKGYATQAWVTAKNYATEAWVTAKGYLTHSYQDRGDPPGWDFFQASFTIDSAWHELDLSSIIPAGPSAALIRFIANPPVINMTIELRERGDVNVAALSVLRTTVGQVWHDTQLIVGLDSTRIIQYRITAGVWSGLFAVVNGWWL